ncbi:hypothetical protein [Streptomyces sp. NPDC045714]|uniref:GntT/GntP/DsdX family permease n=1 Tax=Streptomyces sp. NPDC045714 TaxID=3154913 RepID=UPI0033CC1180
MATGSVAAFPSGDSETAQGSGTAALIITSTLARPPLPTLGLDGTLGSIPIGQVMAIGAGAMVVSHVNDSYFWVVSQFSGMDVKTAYRAHTAATSVQGLSALAAVLVLGAVLLQPEAERALDASRSGVPLRGVSAGTALLAPPVRPLSRLTSWDSSTS